MNINININFKLFGQSTVPQSTLEISICTLYNLKLFAQSTLEALLVMRCTHAPTASLIGIQQPGMLDQPTQPFEPRSRQQAAPLNGDEAKLLAFTLTCL